MRGPILGAVAINFCAECGTKIILGFERYVNMIGVVGGTFDNPDWFARTPRNSKHIYLEFAQHGTVIPSGFNTFQEHASHVDGTPVEPKVLGEPRTARPDTQR